MPENKRFQTELSAFQARFEAQKIAFGPVVFQCVRIAWKKGLLVSLAQKPMSSAELMDEHQISSYVLDVLLESCLSAGVVSIENSLWVLEKTGYMLVNDKLTQVNFNYIHDVCWQGLFELEACLDAEKPLGLKHLGPWATIYEGLSDLPEPAKTSWFEFDHFYSDSAFPEALPKVFASKPKRLMDVGANTGKWAMLCLNYDPQVEMTLVDLPIQLNVAQQNLSGAGLIGRVSLAPRDLLDPALSFPKGHDAIWMSQFLSCFSLVEIGKILARAAESLDNGGSLFILDTCWDRQQFDIAAYCLINTSPYFTAMASGNSKIYRADEYIACAEQAGLQVTQIWDGLGISHSLLQFQKIAK
ncbi:class I SAM-dependent methyltransferase [Chitinibacter sp. S2-10]|uniref:class I SAM-dependent methyltransferase n=1 Tax=Chitinibacter sp. S2-10 TaxID=3373597 RepID=UPI003977942E